MNILKKCLVMFNVICLCSVPAISVAHHSFAGFYDQNRVIEIEGVIKSVSWRNPHGSLILDVEDDEGGVNQWHVETGSISVLRTRGLDREFIKVGERVRIAGEAALRRENGLYARNMLLPNGKEALLSIGIAPRWAESASEELAPEFNTLVEEEAKLNASGIFRVWSTVFEDPDSFPLFKGVYPLRESAQLVKAQWDSSDIVQLGCESKGMPALMITPYPVEFVLQGDDIQIRFEEDNAERIIHMNDNAVKPKGYTSLLGYSTGRWVDGALEVHTSNVSSQYFDNEGTPQSPDMQIVERFMVSEDESRLDYEITFFDPATFTNDFQLSRYWIWNPALKVSPYDCQVP